MSKRSHSTPRQARATGEGFRRAARMALPADTRMADPIR